MAIKKENLAIQASDNLFAKIIAVTYYNCCFDLILELSNQHSSLCNAAT